MESNSDHQPAVLMKQLVHMAVKGGSMSALITKLVRQGRLKPLTVWALRCQCSQHGDFASVKKVTPFGPLSWS